MNRRRRGYTLTEMLITIAIVGVTINLAAAVSRTALGETQRAAARAVDRQAADALERRLREDLRAAVDVDADRGRTTIQLAGRRRVVWRLLEDGRAEREEQVAGDETPDRWTSAVPLAELRFLEGGGQPGAPGDNRLLRARFRLASPAERDLRGRALPPDGLVRTVTEARR